MWTKTVNIFYNKKLVTVLVWLSDSHTDGKEKVSVQAMYNEYYIMEDILFQNRDAAYDFIKHYSSSMARAFFIREGYNYEAIQD